MIQATCHSDDYVIDVKEFDATPVFASYEDGDGAFLDWLLELSACQWGGDNASDHIAIGMEDHDPQVATMFTYLRQRRDQGFECYVDEDSLLYWLKRARPQTYAALIQQAYEGVEPSGWQDDSLVAQPVAVLKERLANFEDCADWERMDVERRLRERWGDWRPEEWT